MLELLVMVLTVKENYRPRAALFILSRYFSSTMASGVTNFTTALLYNKLLRGVAGTFPTTVYVGLFSATPSDTGGGTELSGGGYARVAITVGTSAFSAVATGTCSNGALVDFGIASGAVGTATQFGVFDAATTGNLLLWGDLVPPQTVASGNPYSFAIGTLVAGLA